VPKDVARQNLLRAGMSVYATVDTTEGAKDADNDADLDAPATAQSQ
jgi:membrane fusion protein, multidrug efflux system